MKTNEKYVIRLYKKTNRKEFVTKGHPLFGGMMENTRISLKYPVDKNGRRRADIFTEEEIEELAQDLHIPVDEFNSYSGKFWDTYRLELTKDDKYLNLSDPRDYIDYKIAINWYPIIAKNYTERKTHPYIKYYVDKVDNENKRLLGVAKARKEVYDAYAKYEENKYVLKYVLERLGHITPSSTKLEVIQEMILDYIERDVYKMQAYFKEDNLIIKGLILEATESGILSMLKNKTIRSRNTELGNIVFKGEEPKIGNVAKFLADKKNSSTLTTLKALINNAKK